MIWPRWILIAGLLSSWSSIGLGQTVAPQKKEYWLPPFVVSATVETVAGSTGSYLPPGPGSVLAGFVTSEVATYGKAPHGLIQFRLPAQNKDPKHPPSSAMMTPGPLKLKRVLRHPQGKQVKGIEYLAVHEQKIYPFSPPGHPNPPEEPVTLRQETEVSIIPFTGDPRRGRMWIVHRDDRFGGIYFAIYLNCVLDPEQFPVEH